MAATHESEAAKPLAGRAIGITADRRWEEQANLFAARGATTLHGPTMRTVDLSGDERLREATERVIERPPGYLVATTGMGMRMWLEAAEAWGCAEPLLGALGLGAGTGTGPGGTRVIARGAKASSAVKRAGLDVWWRAPHETMDEIVERLREEPGVASSTLALQLFDPEAHPSTDALRQLVDDLIEVPVYRWLLPEDPAPAVELIRATIERRLDAVTFTSQPAVHNLFRIAAGTEGDCERLQEALRTDVVPMCIGPVCAEALVEEGVARPIFPDPPRLTLMVRHLTDLLAGEGISLPEHG